MQAFAGLFIGRIASSPFGGYVGTMAELEIPEPGVPMLNLYLRTEIGPIDVLGSILGIGEFERVRAGAIEIELFGRRCLVISLDDLIRAKEALGREKDLLAVKELKAIREKQGKP